MRDRFDSDWDVNKDDAHFLFVKAAVQTQSRLSVTADWLQLPAMAGERGKN